MTPAFHSWSQFFAMGGYAIYVWLSVGIALLILGAIVAHTLYQRQRLLQTIALKQDRERRILAAKKRKQTPGEHA